MNTPRWRPAPVRPRASQHWKPTFPAPTCGTAACCSAATRATDLPLWVKLSPNVTDITEIARAAEAAGADAISLINTLLGMAIDLEARRAELPLGFGGLSGPAIKPIALRMVWQVTQAVRIPVVGMGGIMTGQDALEFLLAGAAACQVGTASFADPTACRKIVSEMEAYLRRRGIATAAELCGKLHIAPLEE